MNSFVIAQRAAHTPSRLFTSGSQVLPLSRIIVLLAIVSVFPSNASAQTRWTWKTENVDSAAHFTALAIDKSGNVHVAYAGGPGSELKYAFRQQDTGRWSNLSLESQLGSFAVNIALDPSGKPQICYTPRSLKIATWDGKKWLTQEVDPGHGTVEYNCSITFSADGTPYLVWYQTRGPGGANFLHIKCAVKRDGIWYAKTIDYDRESGKWNSIVIDSQGVPHVGYSAFPPGDLKYAFSVDSREWKVSEVDWPHHGSTKDSTGMGVSLNLDPGDHPVMSFYEASMNADAAGSSEGVLKLARLEEGKWKIESVTPVLKNIGWTEFTSDLVFDREGHAHIRYEDGGAVKHAYWDGQKWQLQLVVPPGGEAALYSSMKIGPDDTIYISYRDPVDGSLKVAVGTAVSETSPKTATPGQNHAASIRKLE